MCDECLLDVDTLISDTLGREDHYCKQAPIAVIAGPPIFCDLLKGHRGNHFNEETGWVYP